MEGLKLEKSALLCLHGGNLSPVNVFDKILVVHFSINNAPPWPGCSNESQLNPGLAHTFISFGQLFGESFFRSFLFSNFFECKVLPNIGVEQPLGAKK